jgi:SAM-dependent methyltransferase
MIQDDFLHVLGRHIPPEANVLELGCGEGRTLAALRAAVRHGIDVEPGAVQRARELHPGLRFDEDDAVTFRRPERYDAIICDRLVHRVADVQRMLENASAHLADTGRVYLSCLNFLRTGLTPVAALAGARVPGPPSTWLDQRDVLNLAELAGLSVLSYENRLLLPSPAPLLRPLANRYLAKLPGLRRLSVYRVYVLGRRRRPVRGEPSVSVIVPARNEAGNIEAVLARVPVMGRQTEVVFVEGHSRDGTWEEIQRAARAYGGSLRVSSYRQSGIGKGDAVRLGFEKATGDMLMILDADLTVAPEDLPKLYEAMRRGLTDYAHGNRLVYPLEGGAMRPLNRLANLAFGRLFSFLLDRPIGDTLCGTKVIWKSDYARLAKKRAFFGDFDPFGDFDLIFGAVRADLRIVEVPIRYHRRTYGTTNIDRFRDGWLLLKMSFISAQKLKFV